MEQDPLEPLLSSPAPAPEGEFDSSLPTPEEVCALHVSTMGHIPKSLRVDWGSLFLELLTNFLHTRSKPDFQLLWMAPKTILGPLKRGGKRNGRMLASTLRRRLQHWHAGQYSELWAEAKRGAFAGSKKRPRQQRPHQRGLLSKACAMQQNWRPRTREFGFSGFHWEEPDSCGGS